MSHTSAGHASGRPTLLFVLGMGRSGTSALTRVLSLCGANLPPGMLGADPGNPRGYWEPRAALHLNEKFLFRHRSSYFDPTLRLQEGGELDGDEREAFIAKISAYLAAFPEAPVTVIKALHISFLSGMWFEAARRTGFDTAAVVAVRNPMEVSASLAKFMGASPQLSGALWLKYNLLAERHTRGMPRTFVEYSNFLDDWHREVKRVAEVLPADLDTSDAPVDDFLEDALRRNRSCGPVIEPFGNDWLSVAYDTLGAAARDETWNESTLDRVYDTYRATEMGFRTMHDEFDDLFNVRYRLSRLFIKPVHEAMALAHRRSGTWA